MSFYDKSPRLLMTNALVQVASVASSSMWFAISIVTLLLATVLPFTKTQLPPTIPRLPSEAAYRTKSRSPSSSVSGPTSLVVPRGANCLVSLDGTTGVIRGRVARGASPAITVVPPISGAITITAHPDREVVAVTATLTPDVAPEQPHELVAHYPAISNPTPSSDGPSEDPQASSSALPESQVKSSPHKTFRDVLRRKGKRSSLESSARSRSASRSSSPIRKLIPDVLKREPSEAADAHGRIPYRSNPEQHEILETKFVNPFKRKSRRSGSVSSTPESLPCDLPTPPRTAPASASAGATPRRRLSAALARAMRPLHDAAARSPSLRRWSVSSGATSSSASTASSAASSCRAPPLSRSGSAASSPRTQPYGAPYFAPMPLPTPPRRSSGVRQPIAEDGELQGAHVRRTRTVVERKEDNALGVSLGAEARHRRFRSLDVASR